MSTKHKLYRLTVLREPNFKKKRFRTTAVVAVVVQQFERKVEDGASVEDYTTAGNVLGEINFLTKSERHRTVRCETPVKVRSNSAGWRG